MPETWAISGVDLHVDLGAKGVRESLERSLREAVQTGRLAAGTRLPPSRTLALDLGVARNTVAEAYAQLVAEGWLVARQGSGTRVASISAPERAPADDAPQRPSVSIRHDLRPGFPDVTSFPRSQWLATARTALSLAPADAFGYADPAGRVELRTALATYLSRARGVRCSPDDVVVVSGFTQGLWMLARVLHASGARRVAVEGYGHERHRQLLRHAGLHLVPLEIDEHGAVPAQLDAVDAVVLTPAHQFPTGSLLSAERRATFARWAAARGALVIEDDYDGEFRYDRRALGAMQALAPEHVVYAGTASKTLAPGLRLAWLVAPPRLRAAAVAEREFIDGHSAVLDQLTLAAFISSGRYDRHVRRSRLAYQRRRDRLVSALARRVPSASVHGLPAGLHAVVDLPQGLDEASAVSRCAARGLAVEGLGSFAAPERSGEPLPSALVIGYATPPTHAYTNALSRLCAALETG